MKSNNIILRQFESNDNLDIKNINEFIILTDDNNTTNVDYHNYSNINHINELASCSKNSNLLNYDNDVIILRNENVLPVEDRENVEIEDYGIKKRKKNERLINKLNREKGQSYKKIKKDKTFELVGTKVMRSNPCLDKKCSNTCSTKTESERMIIFNRY